MKITAPVCHTLAIALALALTSTAHATPEAAAQAGTRQSPSAAKVKAKATRLAAVEVVGQAPITYNPTDASLTRSGASLHDTPQSISVIGQAQIKDLAMRDMADVVRYVPGVGMAQGEGNRDTPVFRGNASTADLFIDGLRDDVQYFRDLYNIERAEVMKGPNAMLFGRGGSGGLLNRVSKQADWNEHGELDLQYGSWAKRRATIDVGQGFNEQLAGRLTALRERDNGFREGYTGERWGVNPTLSLTSGEHGLLQIGVEHFHDQRTADRGLPSFQGRPLAGMSRNFFGDPERSTAKADVNAANIRYETAIGNSAQLISRLRVADYDKFYQNVLPGVVTADRSHVSLTAYNNATDRQNLLSQTDLVLHLSTGNWRHTLLTGIELSHQVTDNFRRTGFFTAGPVNASNAPTSIQVAVDNPIYTGPIQFQQRASDADNHSVANNAAVYVQDQIEFSPQWQAVLGLRYDAVDTRVDNHRNDSRLNADDQLLSPRAGLIYQPLEALSLYANYSVAFLPRAGEQLASLSATNAALEPEKFENLELGAKWDIRHDLSASAALFRLDRSNVAILDPADVTRLILLQGAAQRVRGVELSLTGNVSEHWQVLAGYALQHGEFRQAVRASATSNLPAGATLAQLPKHSISLWNRFDFSNRWGAGLGVIHRDELFASTSNAVTVPSYTRVDAAIYFTASANIKWQLNIENLLDSDYFISANSDNNISPGAPRAFTLGLNWRF